MSHSETYDSLHPRSLIPELCKLMYHQGWVTGTGGGMSIKEGYTHLLTLQLKTYLPFAETIFTLLQVVSKRNVSVQMTCLYTTKIQTRRSAQQIHL